MAKRNKEQQRQQIREVLAKAARVLHPDLGEVERVCSKLERNIAALRKELDRLHAERTPLVPRVVPLRVMNFRREKIGPTESGQAYSVLTGPILRQR